jgi:hypothetical protein
MTKIDAWHFVPEDRMLRYGSNLLVEVGYVYSEPAGELAMCQHGMHASRHPSDALVYAPGPVLCRVRCWGDVQEQGDKLVCRYREVVEMRDISHELRLYACWCVRETPLADGRKVWDLLTDSRSRAAVEIAEQFCAGTATLDQLDAAWAAASAAGAAGVAAREAAAGAAWAASTAGAAHRTEFQRIVSGMFDAARGRVKP